MPAASGKERHELAVRVAWLYHERHLTQQAIADRLGISRSTISRLLAEAERAGIVRVIVTEPLPESARLAESLIERYPIEGATVELAAEDQSPMDAAATALARRVERMVTAGSVAIAAGWGRTLGRAAQVARQLPTSGVILIDAFGHTTTPDIAPSVEVTNTLGVKFGARVMHMPAPGFAPSEAIAKNFLDSEPVASAMKRAQTADAVIVSIGVVGDESLLLTAGYLEESAMRRVVAAGAVGEIFGRYFDAAGNPVEPQVVHPVALTLDDLRAAGSVIAAAGGAEKRDAIQGALAAGVISELAVDDTLAEALLA